MDYIDSEDSEGGPAAQTGSLMHVGAAEFHTAKGNFEQKVRAAWQAIANARDKFPLADPDEVRLFLTPYMNDLRNQRAAFATIKHGPRAGEPAVEMQVEFTLQPHSLDPIKEPIHVQGTLDQIRIDERGRYCVHDIKTGKPTAWHMIHDYAVQQAAYTYAAMQTYPEKQWVSPKLIRCYGYRERNAVLPCPDGVFVSIPYTVEHIPVLLDTVALGVALVRMGEVHANPGSHCTYCELEGILGCMRRFDLIAKGEPPSSPLLQLGKR